jgi:amino acid adenylation domain-containing protein
VRDFSGLTQSDKLQKVHRQVDEEANRPFDLAQGPLFRSNLLMLGEQEHVLLITMHHITSDGWSMGVFFHELALLYNAFVAGKPSPLPELPIQYADFALWQRQWLQGAALDALLSYWTEQLADAPRQLDLPTDFPRPPVQTHRGGHHVVQLPESVVSSLRALSQSEGVTIFMSVLAAFALVLSRHTGQEDIVVGTPVANRPRLELEGMIGLFLNTLVLRTKLSGDPTMRELLRQVRKVCLGAYAHQELPFERLVEALQPERDMSRTPLFQVFLNLVDLSETTLNLPGLTVSPLGGAAQAAKFDFTLYVFLTGTRGTVRWNYNRDLFDASTIAWMAEHFHAVLTHLPEILDNPISSVSLLRKEDRARLRGPTDLVCPSEPFVAFPETALEQSLPARFEEQAHERPDQLAVHTAQYQWTYGAINRRANQIAHTLLSRRLPAGARVALLCAHDAPMVAAVLGVLKAGYTYVPLDPFFPPARLESIVTDAGALAVLTESAYLPLARKLGGAIGQVLTLDEAFAQAKTSDPQHRVSPDTLAYILYTSGTTGVPKGVMQSHRHVLHHIRVYTNNLHLRAEDRLTLLTPYGFDAAVMNLYGALLNGACLYPLDLREADPATIPAWMEQHAITIYHSTPTVYRYWTRTLEEGPTLPACRLIVLGGEAATRADFEAYRRHFGRDCLFVNGLGPTESTVSLQFVADHSTEIIGQTMPVGYPVEHTEIALLDQDGKETAVYGEIAIRSPYVAVGYWHQPELTQKAFDSPSEPRGARLYRTGDMGRRRFDGSLEFMGRKDTQVKIRGFRIEVREIEFVLGQHPAIGGVVVVTGEDRHGNTHLVAYLVINEAPSPSISDIRSFLKQKLPEYMIPSAFMFMDALPSTPNGKVDYRSLPMPDFERSQLETKYVAPRTPVEKALAKIWGEVLALERIGVHDNFFELGGHSLKAAQVVSRTRDNFGIELPLLRLFETPTIAGLTELIEMIRLADQGPLSDREATTSEWEEGEL